MKKKSSIRQIIKEPFFITNVSNTIFSIARHYGGCKVGSSHFYYELPSDLLIRKDVFKDYLAMKKKGMSLEEIAKVFSIEQSVQERDASKAEQRTESGEHNNH